MDCYVMGKALACQSTNEARRLLFEQIVKMDLEGMVCKRKNSPYRVTEKPSPYWIKVKNPRYSQAEDQTNCSSAPPYTVPKWLKSTSILYNPCQLRTIRVANETIHHAN